MMENIYSSKNFQEISEAPGAKKIHLELTGHAKSNNQAYGLMHNNVAKFGTLSPFWLPNFLEKNSDIIILNEFICDLISQCNTFAQAIEIRLPPSFYNSNIEVFKYLLQKNQFKVTQIAIWQYIPLKKFNSAIAYEASLKHSSRKVLKNFNNLYKSNIKEIDLQDYASIDFAFDLINANRNLLGTSLKYSKAYLKRLIEIEPSKIKIFIFNHDEDKIAAAICHITNITTLYVAAWGDANHQLKYSPMYSFAFNLVNFCLKNNIEYLDFGISSTIHEYTPGLFNFKKNIGCIATIQETFRYINNPETPATYCP